MRFSLGVLRNILTYIFVTALLAYSWSYRDVTSPNERSRAYLAVAIVDHGTISIDKPFKRFGKIVDKAKYKDSLYTDKAPGSGFLAAGVYAVARIFSEPEDWRIGDLLNLFRTFLMIPLGLLAFWLVRRLLFSFGISPPIIDVVSVSLSLGSAVFHYSTVLMGHHIVMVLFLGVLCLERKETSTRLGLLSKLFSMGLLAGLAGFTEYQSSLWCVPLAVYVIFKHRKEPLSLIVFFAGAAVFLGLLMLYNHCAFGGVFELSYHHLSEKMQKKHSAGIAGVSVPSPLALGGILFSSHRGIFFGSPLFLLCIPGFISMIRGKGRAMAVFLLASFVGYLLFVSAAEIWHGGWAFGPRLLVPVMGALCVPVAVCLQRLKAKPIPYIFCVGLAVWGILYNQLTHLVFQTFPPNAFNPLYDAVFPAARELLFSPNLLTHHLGVTSPVVSVLPALLAILGTVFLISLRPIKAERPDRSAVLALTALAPSVLMCLILALYGHAWTPEKVTSFNSWLKKMNKHEAAMLERDSSGKP